MVGDCWREKPDSNFKENSKKKKAGTEVKCGENLVVDGDKLVAVCGREAMTSKFG